MLKILLDLTAGEVAALDDILRSYLSDLRIEIRDTEKLEMRQLFEAV